MLTKSQCCALLVVCAIAMGCSTNAPKYNSNMDNVGKLRAANLAPTNIGPISKDPTAKVNVDKLTIRAGTYSSPYGSFTAFLQEALKQEFEDARLLDPNSKIEISGVLVRNVLDGSGASLGFAEMEARLMVKRDGATAYDASKSARIEWESSFAGAVAIPRANQNYPNVIQKLLGEFYADPKFIAALKK